MPLPLRLCLCLLSLVWSYRVSAQTPLPADGLFSAKNHVQFLIDHSGRLTRQQAWADSARFQPILADIPQFASRQVPHWFRARVVNPTGRPASLVAEIDYPFLDSTVFFILDTHGRLLTRSPPLSWAMPASKRPLLHHNPLLPFVLGPHSQAWLYVRVRAGKMRLTLPLRLHTSTGFLRADRQQRTFWDATMGLMGFIVLFSLFLFVLLRDLIYAFYGLYVLASLFYLIGNEGYGLVWLDRPMYGFISPLDFPIVSLYLAILASFGLIRVYVLPSVLHHRWIKRIYRVSVLGPVLATVFLLSNVSQWVGTGIGGSILPLLEPLAYMIPVVFMPGLLVYLSLRRLPVSHPESVATVPARLYLLAVSLPLIQVLLGFLRERDLIPDQFINREGAALTSIAEFLVLIVALGYRYKRMVDDRRNLAEQTYRQQQQATETQLLLQQEQNRVLAGRLQLQQEKERIARDLHDHVGSQLSIIANSLGEPGHELLGNGRTVAIGTYVREAMQSLRDTIWAIHQEEISLAGFRIHVRQYLSRQHELVETSALVLRGAGGADVCLNSFQALTLFRILQEALQNALKHAYASQVTVTLDFINTHLHLRIDDDGNGFLLENQPHQSTHYGLRNMEYRAQQLGADYQICSAVGQGTHIWVQLDTTVPVTAKNTAVAV